MTLSRFTLVISVFCLLGCIFISLLSDAAEGKPPSTWRDTFNTKNSLCFDQSYCIAWTKRNTLISKFFEVDSKGNSFVIEMGGNIHTESIVSYDPLGNERFRIGSERDTQFTMPVVSQEDKVAFFDGNVYNLLDPEGKTLIKSTLKDNLSGPSRPMFTESGSLLFTASYDQRPCLVEMREDGTILSKDIFNLTSYPLNFIPGKNGTVLLVGNRYLSLVGHDGSLSWTLETKDIARCLMKGDGSIYIMFKEFVAWISPEGKYRWMIDDFMEEDLEAISIDKTGNLLLLTSHYNYNSISSNLRKFDLAGKTVWNLSCPYSNSPPIIDEEGNIIIGGSKKILKTDPDGNILAVIYNDDIVSSNIAIIGNDTFLILDNGFLTCMRIPFTVKLSSSQELFGYPKIKMELIMKDPPIELKIQQIEFWVITDEYIYNGEKTTEIAYIKTYSADTRTFTVKDPPDEKFIVRMIFEIEDGERLRGPSLTVTQRDQTLGYVALWSIITIPLLILMSMIIAVFYKKMRKKDNETRIHLKETKDRV